MLWLLWDFSTPLASARRGVKAGFNNLRVSEIKHARVAMMAALDAVVQHYVKFPGFEDVPTGLAAVATPPGTYGFAALFLVSGLMELAIWTEDGKKEPGNFGDPVGLACTMLICAPKRSTTAGSRCSRPSDASACLGLCQGTPTLAPTPQKKLLPKTARRAKAYA